MKYVKYKLIWSGTPAYGTGPQDLIAAEGGSLQFVYTYPNAEATDWFYAYLEGSIDLDAYGAYSLTEVTQSEMLENAQERDPGCYLDDNGRLQFTPRPFPGLQ